MRDNHDDTYTDGSVCPIGNHPHRGATALCDRHLDQMRDELAGVARYTARLTDHLAPGPAGTVGDKVSTSRIGSPTSARLDVLNMIGGGGREIRRDARTLHVQVRRWSTRTPYQADTIRDGKRVTETRYTTGWHSQLITDGVVQPSTCACGTVHDPDAVPTGTPVGRPLLTLDDDQVGAIPPAEWADEWVRRWRLALGRTRSPLRARVDLACDADQRKRVDRARIGESLRAARQAPVLMPAVARLIAVQRLYEQHLQQTRQQVAQALLGVRSDGPDHQQRVTEAITAASLDPTRVLHDPVTAEWAVRYGHAHTAAAVELDTRRLTEWLELAADTDDPDQRIDLTTFARELRSLYLELAHIVGAVADDVRLGRCPAFLRDTDGSDTDRLCGYTLWQDPYRDLVECARCRTSWPKRQWLNLAGLIRRRWPVDRNRRYTQADRTAAETNIDYLPRCTGCERPMRIEWRDATGRRDLTRFWAPTGTVCPAGCIAGGVHTVVAA